MNMKVFLMIIVTLISINCCSAEHVAKDQPKEGEWSHSDEYSNDAEYYNQVQWESLKLHQGKDDKNVNRIQKNPQNQQQWDTNGRHVQLDIIPHYRPEQDHNKWVPKKEIVQAIVVSKEPRPVVSLHTHQKHENRDEKPVLHHINQQATDPTDTTVRKPFVYNYNVIHLPKHVYGENQISHLKAHPEPHVFAVRHQEPIQKGVSMMYLPKHTHQLGFQQQASIAPVHYPFYSHSNIIFVQEPLHTEKYSTHKEDLPLPAHDRDHFVPIKQNVHFEKQSPSRFAHSYPVEVMFRKQFHSDNSVVAAQKHSYTKQNTDIQSPVHDSYQVITTEKPAYAVPQAVDHWKHLVPHPHKVFTGKSALNDIVRKPVFVEKLIPQHVDKPVYKDINVIRVPKPVTVHVEKPYPVYVHHPVYVEKPMPLRVIITNDKEPLRG